MVDSRKEFYSNYPIFFADVPGLEYALYDVHKMDSLVVREIKYATKELSKILIRAKNHIQCMNTQELLALGFPEETHQFLNLDYLRHHTQHARFDFIVTEDGKIKMLELNNCTPFLLAETFVMNNEVCNHFGVTTANTNSDLLLRQSARESIEDCMRYLDKRDCKIVIASRNEDIDYEEYLTTINLQGFYSPHNEVTWDDIHTLRVVSEGNEEYERGLYTQDMERIDILIRPAHPIEFLFEDVAEDGQRIGVDILELVRDKELAMINTPSSYILQSKMILALVWFFYEYDLGLTEHEKEIVSKYMLPTYVNNFPFLNKKSYVKKPIFSREGSSVEIFKLGEENTKRSQFNFYDDYPSIYQEYLQLPKKRVTVEGLEKDLSYIIGSFVVSGEPAGLSCRLGGEITEWDSHWMAVGIK